MNVIRNHVILYQPHCADTGNDPATIDGTKLGSRASPHTDGKHFDGYLQDAAVAGLTAMAGRSSTAI